MRRGYIKLWRKLQENPLWKKRRRFSRAEAWIDIIAFLARGIDGETEKRGQFCGSDRVLAKRWGWSKTGVRRFKTYLLQQNMIEKVDHQGDRERDRGADHFIVCNYETYNGTRTDSRTTEETFGRTTLKGREKNGNKESANADHVDHNQQANAVNPESILEIYQRCNDVLPAVRTFSIERKRKCRARINQARRDGRLDQYLDDFENAVKKAQGIPFLRGEGSRGWRAGFDWFIGKETNLLKVLEGVYDERSEVNYGADTETPETTTKLTTSRGEPIYKPTE